jgi:diguanylate cyclase (GGDEF)-like protein
VVLVDLDAFRDINAAFGHAGGDEVLTAVADRLKRSVRTEDLAARFEADRFAIVLERLHTLADATLVVERTAAAIATPLLTYVGEWVRPTASLGVALGDGTVADSDALLRAAEGALAQAKRAGGERIVFAASSDDPTAATPADLLAAP